MNEICVNKLISDLDTGAQYLVLWIAPGKSDWLRRRANEVCKERASLCKPTTVKTIKYELYLRESTFVQYEKMFQEVIDNIYD
jgi:hypothetical protein